MDDVARLEKRIIRAAAQAIRDFALVEHGDWIMVAVSGGKDSYTLLHVLMRLRERAPIDFELVAVNLDQGQPGYPAEVVERHFRSLGVNYRMIARDTYSVVRRLVPEGKTTCSVCSPLRRGDRDAMHEDRPRPPPRRSRRDPPPQRPLLRLAEEHAGQAPREGRQERGRAPALLRSRGGHLRVRRGHALPHRAVRPVRVAAEPAAPPREGAPRRALRRAPRREGKPAPRARPCRALAPPRSRSPPGDRRGDRQGPVARRRRRGVRARGGCGEAGYPQLIERIPGEPPAPVGCRARGHHLRPVPPLLLRPR